MGNYSSFACPNPTCKFYNQFNQGNIAHRSWVGRNQQIERLRCSACKRELSSRKGTLMEYSKISAAQTELLLKCIRWGVCDEGVADICQTTVKTVRLFHTKVAKRGKMHHDNAVRDLDEHVVQCDELRAKMAKKIRWVGLSIATNSLMILSGCVGKRVQAMADRLLAEAWGRMWVMMTLTDGWAPYLMLC